MSSTGTVRERTGADWNISFPQIHPRPRLRQTQEELGNKNRTAIFISLRDPVDRFVSSFYWRLLISCDPEGDTRSPGNAPNNPGKYCTHRVSEREQEILFYRYNRDANELASALCSTNVTKAKLAANDMKRIEHTRHTIVDWLGWNLTVYEDKLFPIVLEPSYDFKSQVDDVIRWAYNISRFEDESLFLQRQAAVYTNDCISSRKKAEKQAEGGSRQHSSSSIKQSLSERNELCVARHFSSDYELLSQIKDMHCQTETCRLAIQSILARRVAIGNFP